MFKTAKVAVDKAAYHFDLLFDYLIPQNLEEKVKPGCRVLVPFGGGNRTSAMVYGPGRTFVVLGKNKLTPDIPSAIERIKTVACPQNARRIGLPTPCAKTGKCHDCSAKVRMCRVTTIYSYPLTDREVRVYLVGEELGF